VFANISPTLNEHGETIDYYSVRRKPREGFKSIIEPLYKHLLSIEQSGGMEASLMEVENLLKKYNMSFNELMIKIQKGLINEL
jgi:hypothetical protein